MIKIIALGFFSNTLPKKNKPYILNVWNILDFLVVVTSLADFMLSGQAGVVLSGIKALRALRALRPLRVISRNQGLKLVVNALFSSIPAMFNVILVCAVFLVIFAVIGINFFKGKFYFCKGLEDSVLNQINTKKVRMSLTK